MIGRLKRLLERLLMFNCRTKGVPAVCLGFLIITVSLALSSGYIPGRGFLASLPYMEVVVSKPHITSKKTGERISGLRFSGDPDIRRHSGFSIPTKYLVTFGLMLIFGGVALAFSKPAT